MANHEKPVVVHSQFFTTWAELVLRYRWVTLSLLALVTFGACYQIATRLVIDHSVDSFAPPDAPEIKTLHEFRDTFGRADPFIVLVEGEVFSRPFLDKLAAFHTAIESIDVEITPSKHITSSLMSTKAEDTSKTSEGDIDDWSDEDWGDEGSTDEDWGDEQGSVIARVVSLINIRKTTSNDGALEIRKLMQPLPDPAELPALKREVLNDSFMVGQVVGRAGKHAVLTIYPVDMYDGDVMKITDEILALSERFESPDFKIYVMGLPALGRQINHMIIDDFTLLGSTSLLAVILTLIWLFRSWMGVFGPVLVIMISVLWTLGFMATAGLSVNILSSIIPAMLFCVGVGDSIHMLSIYRDQKREGVSGNKALIQAVSITGPPVFFTSLTTMVGLFSLNFASVTAISEMGIAGGFGVVVAWFLSLTLLPIILSFNPKAMLGAELGQPRDWIQRFILWCIGLSSPTDNASRPQRILWISALLGVMMLWGTTQIRVFHDDLAMLPDDTPVKVAIYKLDEHVGGMSTAEIVITPTSGTLKDQALIAGLDRVASDVLAYEEPGTGQKIVTHGISIVDVAKELRRALHGGAQEEYRVPESQRETQDLLFLFENQSPDDLRSLVTVDWTKTHMTFRIRWREATSYTHLIHHIEDSVKRHLGTRVKTAGTGPVYVGSRLVQVMLYDLAVSFLTAFMFVTLFMVLMLRDLKLGLIAMLPNLFPIAIVLGFMGLFHIPLDLNALLIASIALGIAVDDTVHFLHHFQVAYEESQSCEAAIHSATQHAGRAMVTTSAILTMGFLNYCLGSNEAIFRFGFLTALTVVSALLIDLIVLPAFLRVLYPEPTSELNVDPISTATQSS
jgi:hypothetical protein